MRTIIAGSRDITDYSQLLTAMANCGWVPTVILSGAATGADTLGEQYATENNLPLEEYPADWGDIFVEGAVVKLNKFGKHYNVVAGFQRNELMASKAEALVALHKNNSKGTLHMIKVATQKGLRVYIHKVI